MDWRFEGTSLGTLKNGLQREEMKTCLEGCSGDPVGSDNKNGERWTELKCVLDAELTGLIGELVGELDVENKEEPRMTPGVRT